MKVSYITCAIAGACLGASYNVATNQDLVALLLIGVFGFLVTAIVSTYGEG